MCGVWGKIYSGSLEQRESDIVQAVKSLAHRGPDDFGYFVEDNLALLHTRLSIIDLTTGRQPLLSFNERYVGIFNGELYDFEAHRSSLEKEGVSFKTKSDSEVFLNLFAFYGAACLQKLSGEFAFIIFDRKEKCIFFGRDLHGVKPLFFRQDEKAFEVASEIKALLNGQPPEFDRSYVERFFAGLIVMPRTAVQSVLHVLPGRLYKFSMETAAIESENYSTLFSKEDRNLDGQAGIDLVDRELHAAVKRRLRADVPVGVYLSGGLDSSLIASIMTHLGQKPEAFTVGFDHAAYDESAFAAKTAKHLGLNHNLVTLNKSNFLPSLKKSILAFENPVFNTHGAAKNLLADLASDKVRVVLSGEGADEWFGGYAYQRIRKLLDFQSRHPIFAEKTMDLFSNREGLTAKGHLDGKRREYSDLIGKHFGKQYPALLGRLVAPRNLRYLISTAPETLVDEGLKELKEYLNVDFPEWNKGADPLNLELWMGMRSDLLHYVLANVGDRQDMCHSLEGRTPFMDQHLVEVSRRLSPHLLIRGLQEKYVLREIAKKYLPREVSRKRKFAFFAPATDLLSPQYSEEVLHYIAVAKETIEFLPWKRIDKILEADPDVGRRQNLLTAFFSMGVLREHLNETAQPHPRGYKLPQSARDLKGHRLSL